MIESGAPWCRKSGPAWLGWRGCCCFALCQGKKNLGGFLVWEVRFLWGWCFLWGGNTVLFKGWGIMGEVCGVGCLVVFSGWLRYSIWARPLSKQEPVTSVGISHSTSAPPPPNPFRINEPHPAIKSKPPSFFLCRLPWHVAIVVASLELQICWHEHEERCWGDDLYEGLLRKRGRERFERGLREMVTGVWWGQCERGGGG